MSKTPPVSLEPSLTVYDRKVLATVPSGSIEALLRGWETQARTVWEMAELLQTFDLEDVYRELRSLRHLGYIASAPSHVRGVEVWVRLRKGDEAVGS